MNKIDEFLIYIFPIIKPIYLKHWDIGKTKDLPFNEIGSNKEKYLKKVYVYFQTVKESLDKLNNTLVYLTIDDVPEHYKTKDIEDIEFYRYHIENFHIRCISIIDYIALTVNHSLQLGIPIRKCNTYSITENTNVKNTQIASLLNAFEKEFHEMKTIRNKLIHQGTFNSEELSDIDSALVSPMTEEFMGQTLVDYLKEERTQKINNVVEKFKIQIDRMEYNVGEIVEQLKPLIEKQIKIFELSE